MIIPGNAITTAPLYLNAICNLFSSLYSNKLGQANEYTVIRVFITKAGNCSRFSREGKLVRIFCMEVPAWRHSVPKIYVSVLTLFL